MRASLGLLCAVVALASACDPSPTPPVSPAVPPSTAPPADPPAEPAPPHPLLGSPARVELHRYRPYHLRTLTTPEEIAAATRAIGEHHEASGGMPRTMPFAEVTYYDAAGTALATAVFLTETDAGYFSLGDRGTRALSAEEAAALRALFATDD